MKKLILFLFLFLTLSVWCNAADMGITCKYTPTAGSFEKGFTQWVYVHDGFSLGLYGSFFNKLIIKNKLIITSIEDSIYITGNIIECTASMGDVLTVDYSCIIPFQNISTSPVFDLCTEVVHRLSLNVDISFFK